MRSVSNLACAPDYLEKRLPTRISLRMTNTHYAQRGIGLLGLSA